MKKIAILNCDLDASNETNGASLLQGCIFNSQIINICHGEELENINSFSGFVITGSRAHITDDHAWITNLRELVRAIHRLNLPCLAICFGMDIVAEEFGGTVLINEIYELGFKQIEINKNSKLFDSIGNQIWVYECHHDVTEHIPAGASLIAQNDCGIQAFVFDNFYCVQFHPEIGAETARVMAERDGDCVFEVLARVGDKYNLPYRVLENFILIVEES